MNKLLYNISYILVITALFIFFILGAIAVYILRVGRWVWDFLREENK